MSELISPLGQDSLDIEKIRDKFKNYLVTEDIIKDVNYLGSNTSVLVDIIAYAIQSINSTNAMTNNQNILALSTVRSNIIQLGKQLGYDITRVISSKMNITIEYPVVNGQFINISAGTKFTTDNYVFINSEDILLTESSPSFTTDVVEGDYIDSTIDTKLHVVTDTEDMYKFVLNYRNIGNDSIKMSIKKSGASTWDETWTRVDSLTKLTKDKNYYYEEYIADSGWVSISTAFAGNGYILSSGDEIKFSFLISNGSVANGLASVSFSEPVLDNLGVEINPTMIINSNSRGGADEESDQSMKDNAPLFFNTGNRVVNELDYEAHLENSSLVDVAVSWGGELMATEKLGYIYISAIPQDTNSKYLSTLETVTLLELLSDVRILSTHRIFWQPTYINVSFDIKIIGTVANVGDRQASITTVLNDYFNNDVTTFRSALYESKMIKEIENVFVNDAKGSVTVDIKPSLQLAPELFSNNLTDDKLNLITFIPTSNSKYYLTKDGVRINVPEDDRDLIGYYENGWTRVYEADEDLTITFSANNVNDIVTETLSTVANEIIHDDGTTQTVVGNFDTTESILYLKREYFADNVSTITFNIDIMPVLGDTLTNENNDTATVLRVDQVGTNGQVGIVTILIISGDWDNAINFDVGDTFEATTSSIITNDTLKLIDISKTKSLDISYSPYFNVNLKHNTTAELGDIVFI